jgi:hypothetical protein
MTCCGSLGEIEGDGLAVTQGFPSQVLAGHQLSCLWLVRLRNTMNSLVRIADLWPEIWTRNLSAANPRIVK